MYTYQVSVVTGGAFDPVDGKLKLTLQNGRNKQILPLSAVAEVRAIRQFVNHDH